MTYGADHHLQVFHLAVGLVEQGFDILPYPLALSENVALAHDVAVTVYAGCSRDEHVSAVAIVNVNATLKAHAVLDGSTEMVGGIEVAHLAFAQSVNRVAVHLAEALAVCLPATNASAGDEVCVGVHALCVEHLVARFHHIIVVLVYVVNVKPSAHAVVAQRATLIHELHHIVVEQQFCLRGASFGLRRVVGAPQMAVAACRTSYRPETLALVLTLVMR